MSEFNVALKKWNRAGNYTYTYDDRNPGESFKARFSGTHDDGPRNLFSLGGIGAGNVGRDLDGKFSRWHTHIGYHRHLAVDAANLALRWQQGERTQSARIGGQNWDRPLPKGTRKVRALFPVVWEYISCEDWPIEILIESYSPVVPGDYQASSLPVAFFDVYVRNKTAAPVDFDTAFFFPNPLGWHPGNYTEGTAGSPLLYEEAEGTSLPAWVDLCNAGNTTEAVENFGGAGVQNGIRFYNNLYGEPCRDMQGEWLVGVTGDDIRTSRSTCYSCFGPAFGSKWRKWMLPEVEEQFFDTGKLLDRDYSWTALSFEVLGGAVSGGKTLEAGEEASFSFALTWDMPLVEAGSGRLWKKAYTEHFGCGGNNAGKMTSFALEKKSEHRAGIEKWHTDILEGGRVDLDNPSVAAAAINELYFLIDGGSLWVSGQYSSENLPEPALGDEEHFSLLEGYDIGYFYYSTFDLYPHAMPLIEKYWPHLSELIFRDFVKSIPMEVEEGRPFYQSGETGKMLEKNKIPHDIGSPAGDVWNVLNDYQYRVNANLWKDHNPLFLISYYLHTVLNGQQISNAVWQHLLGLCDHMEKQDKDNDGLPEHDTAGDSTWDALEETGPVIYSSAITLAAWAAMKKWAEQVDDKDAVHKFDDKLKKAQQAFDDHFWTGDYYRCSPQGDKSQWINCDGLFGILLADSAGLVSLLPDENVKKHLHAVYQSNFKGYADGKYGLSLFAPYGGWKGEAGGTQIGEVLVGSSWSCTALMSRYGLKNEGEEIAQVLSDTLYRDSGLQFRTPAAWTSNNEFRAPINLRPMAVGYLLNQD